MEFFQAKRLRGALQRYTLDLMNSTAGVHPLARAVLLASRANTPVGTALESAAGQQALTALLNTNLPETGTAPEVEASVQTALAALNASRPDV